MNDKFKSIQNYSTSLKLILLFFVIAIISSCARKTQQISFAFYNVENLFDTIDDPHINDNSHLPDSKIPWNSDRYNTKLDNLTRVMSSVDSTGFPTLFGLCEVENIDVLIDLINHPELIQAGYRMLHKDSPDRRGIDVALLYQPDLYQPIETNYLKLTFPSSPNSRTRDILYSKGLAAGRDTLHIFINHWTSRWGGQAETEPKRRFIGAFLKKVTDSILLTQPGANIILAGDLNDNPDDLSILKDLMALPVSDDITNTNLYNLSFRNYKAGEGTLYYRSWDMFDQIIVSGNLLKPKNKIKTLTADQEVIRHDWMLYQPEKGPARPNRTASREYYGGYSDHLPIFIRMSVD